MGRPRAFDETEVTRAAASLFAGRTYDGISVDDLVTHLGVHRNSLYKVFGSKRGLYLAALRWHLEHRVRPLLAKVGAAPDPTQALRDMFVADTASPDLDLLLLAVVERAPVDSEVAEEVARTMRDFDAAIDLTLGDGGPVADDAPSPLAYALTAAILGLRLRVRTGVDAAGVGAVLFDRIHQPQP
ncbi:transcriptional regulator, TetR family [Micromonospora viridifaciens]|uniref:Transcriptional regulator, TetR family n=1 Tax=Micromonospora viridifaciens TaxID=1881 RepID=A0A1C4YD19_MICVI|nr:TetR/AcrR family transcriptional regulator [Micromonospora viridifaciens]SCF18619.1 transcriptional regulator, TetR family [Micromonospora viridifaciens]